MVEIFNVSVIASVVATVASLGLSLRPRDVLAPLRRARIVGPLLGVNVLVVPAVAWTLTRVLGQPDTATTGIALVAVGAGGSLALRTAQLSGRADMSVTLSLVVLLQVVNLVSMPLWVTALSDGTGPAAWRIAQDLVLVILLPLAASMALRAVVPSVVAVRAALVPVANVTLAIAVVAAVVANRNAIMLADDNWTIAATAVAVAGIAIALGWLAAGPDRPTRAAAAIVTGKRFTSVGLVLIGTQLGADPAILGPAVVYALADFAVSVGLAFVWSRRRVTVS
jgi:BASS family bile acid:Na+ symporter